MWVGLFAIVFAASLGLGIAAFLMQQDVQYRRVVVPVSPT